MYASTLLYYLLLVNKPAELYKAHQALDIGMVSLMVIKVSTGAVRSFPDVLITANTAIDDLHILGCLLVRFLTPITDC